VPKEIFLSHSFLALPSACISPAIGAGVTLKTLVGDVVAAAVQVVGLAVADVVVAAIEVAVARTFIAR